MDKEFTTRDEIFVKEYLIDFNVERAAEKAGYSKTVANTKAYVWVSDSQNNTKPHIRKAVLEATTERKETLDELRERVLEQMKNMVFFDVRKLFNGDGQMLPLDRMDDATVMAINGFEVEEKIQASQSEEAVLDYRTKKVKLVDRRQATKDLAEHLGMYRTKVEITGKDGGPIELTDNDFARRMAFILEKAARTNDRQETKGS